MKNITDETLNYLILINPLLSDENTMNNLKIILNTFYLKKFNKLNYRDSKLYFYPEQNAIGFVINDNNYIIYSTSNNNIIIKEKDSLNFLSITINDLGLFKVVDANVEDEIAINYVISFDKKNEPQVVYKKRPMVLSLENRTREFSIFSLTEIKRNSYVFTIEKFNTPDEIDYVKVFEVDKNKDSIEEIYELLLLSCEEYMNEIDNTRIMIKTGGKNEKRRNKCNI